MKVGVGVKEGVAPLPPRVPVTVGVTVRVTVGVAVGVMVGVKGEPGEKAHELPLRTQDEPGSRVTSLGATKAQVLVYM